jgi:hypothetical protein
MPVEEHFRYDRFWSKTDPNKERRILPGITFHRDGPYYSAIVESQMFVDGVEKRWVEWFLLDIKMQNFMVSVYDLSDPKAFDALRRTWQEVKDRHTDIGKIETPTHQIGLADSPEKIYKQLQGLCETYECLCVSLLEMNRKEKK